VNSEDGSTVDYAHTFEAQASIHHIDRGAPSGAELDARLLGALIGAGEHVLQGIVYDQSPLAEVELATSLGDRFTCDDTLQRDAFTSAWSCAITIPAETPDGTRVEVALSATDVYGQSNDTIASWTFEVDTERPRLTLLDASRIEQDSIDGTILVSDTLRLSGFAGDERLLAEVEVCEELDGWRSCQDAALYHHPEMSSTIAVSDTVNWVLEHPVPQGIEGEAVPISVTAYDAMGNSTEIRFEASIDTRGPQVALDRAPSEQIYYRNTFSLSGSVSDLSDVSELRLLVWEPLGNVRYYPITLDSPDAQSSSWTFASDPRYVQFAEHGIYRYEIQAIDRLGNMWASEPYQLSVRDPY
ncbi:MAG TPA: hypothetical protein VER55_01275, partial [Ardenticatenaceae bacterium]|nr:hypothetical protein [Ardenticatenaceae bacterium]